MILVCNECGTTHFGISRAEAEQSVKDAIRLYDRMVIERRGVAPNIAAFEHCSCCGNTYKNFTLDKNKINANHFIISELSDKLSSALLA